METKGFERKKLPLYSFQFRQHIHRVNAMVMLASYLIQIKNLSVKRNIWSKNLCQKGLCLHIPECTLHCSGYTNCMPSN